MRDPNRIYRFCHEFADLWAKNVPDWRFGQLMVNVFLKMQESGQDPFFPEEDKMMEFFREYFASYSSPPCPCDLCMYNPPSSTDGKPCCICPACAPSK